MTSNDVIELGEQFRGAGKKIDKALAILEERGEHEAIKRASEYALKAAQAIQSALDLVVEAGTTLTGPGPLFGEAEKIVGEFAEAVGEGGSVTLTAEEIYQAALRGASARRTVTVKGKAKTADEEDEA